jgi:hypothetical protein
VAYPNSRTVVAARPSNADVVDLLEEIGFLQEQIDLLNKREQGALHQALAYAKLRTPAGETYDLLCLLETGVNARA